MVPAADPTKGKPNRLAAESSPYLLQHAHNPVDWLPWGAEAFEKAQKEGKLVFLSIGYSSCHWCHVMEKESFSDPAIAKVLNENFVCIKVDREERPDVDDVYMTALQVTGISGGWPLTMFLTPEGKPIFGGTYFPPADKKRGEDTIPGMTSVLKKVLELHRDKKKDLYEQADHIAKLTQDELNRVSRGDALVTLDNKLVTAAADAFEFDPDHGGLGRAATEYRGAKFPRVAALLFLLQQSAKPGQNELAKHMARTLDGMARGGIYDHLGGGFHRYSTERTWTVPHFEKMLYDQAQLVELYCMAYRLHANPEYKRIIDETLAFVAREMTAPEGYFYSALDADSEDEEGRFYVWTPKELESVLENEPEAKLFRDVYGLTDKPNFEGKYHILRQPRQPSQEELAKLAPLRKKLFDLRAKRPRPFLDTKLITAWNGQMIAAYALAGQVLKEPKYIAVAEKAAEFVLKTMKGKDERLFRIFAAKPGERAVAKGTAFLDDYAFLIHGLLNLADAAPNSKWSGVASGLQAEQARLYDHLRGGFYTTPHGGEKLFARGQDQYDGAQPSGNGVSARNLARLFTATKVDAYRVEAVRALRVFAGSLQAQPTAVPVLAESLDFLLSRKVNLDPPRADEPAEKPDATASASVVTTKLREVSKAEGRISYAVDLHVADGWHLYANPVNNKELTESATRIAVAVNGKVVVAEITYPKGVAHKDPSGAEYHIYEGKVTATFSLPSDPVTEQKVSVSVSVIACNDKTCLKPSILKAGAK
jgi:hypothetical protein